MTNLRAKEIIRQQPDPLAESTSGRKLSCKDVYAVFDPDPDGLTEVLYVTLEDELMTAYFRGREFVFAGVGW